MAENALMGMIVLPIVPPPPPSPYLSDTWTGPASRRSTNASDPGLRVVHGHYVRQVHDRYAAGSITVEQLEAHVDVALLDEGRWDLLDFPLDGRELGYLRDERGHRL